MLRSPEYDGGKETAQQLAAQAGLAADQVATEAAANPPARAIIRFHNPGDHALAGGITTMIGMSPGPHFDVSCSGPNVLGELIRAADEYCLNFGFLGRGCSDPGAVDARVARPSWRQCEAAAIMRSRSSSKRNTSA